MIVVNNSMTNEIKQYIENIIKKNLPEKKEIKLEEIDSEEKELLIEIYGEAKTPEYLVERRYGFNQALSQINTSLIADEVLKVVVEKIEELRKTKTFPQQLIHQDHSVEYFERLSGGDIHYNQALEDLLLTLSPNKENKNNG